jgi:hypothetical protein
VSTREVLLSRGRLARLTRLAILGLAIGACAEISAAWGVRWLTASIDGVLLIIPLAAIRLARRLSARPAVRQAVSVLAWVDAGVALALLATFPPMSRVPGLPAATLLLLAVVCFAVAVLRGGFATQLLSSAESLAAGPLVTHVERRDERSADAD